LFSVVNFIHVDKRESFCSSRGSKSEKIRCCKMFYRDQERAASWVHIFL
jgi:hypothetical protein